ncbi:hypothetical protein Bca52824_041784 [Brassica carinata]|uniref:CS domain-containing protein n=1 Tax=Brassica carinata TaxID=52824 RepID=A0A8X7RVI1_BRACI|nr:hypothetical protein Bca52824_041784 [Brassica carinata]
MTKSTQYSSTLHTATPLLREAPHLQEQPWPADSHTYRRNRTNQEHSPPGHGEEQLVEHHQVSKRRTDSRRRSLRCEPMEVEKPKIESLKPTEPIGNGLDFEKYSWTQNLQEVTVTIPVPSGTKSRSVACEIKKSRLRVGLKGQEPIIDGEFFNAVKPDDCFWNIEDQKFISVLLTKQDQMQWWKYCLKGEPEIDTQKVELESSKLVEKMMFDQRQKQMGPPTSDEIEKQDIMKKFMSQHPEMNFSNAKFN